MGLDPVACISDRTHDRLSRCVIWHLREEALRAAVVNVDT
jgi:hypothetical protein